MGLLETVKLYWLAGMTPVNTARNIRRHTGRILAIDTVTVYFGHFNASYQSYKVELPRG